jgi:hypothetical protein
MDVRFYLWMIRAQAAVEWVLSVPEEGSRDGVAFRVARQALVKYTELIASGALSSNGGGLGKHRGIDVECQAGGGEGGVLDACGKCARKDQEVS